MYKTIKKIIFTLVGCLVASYLFTRFYESRLFLWETGARWGRSELQAGLFKQGDTRDRASMAYRAVQQQYGRGWTRDFLIKNLGLDETLRQDNSRWYDRAVTYKLENNVLNPWRLAFYYNQLGVVQQVCLEKQIYEHSFYSMVINFLYAPVQIVYAVVRRVLMMGWLREGLLDAFYEN